MNKDKSKIYDQIILFLKEKRAKKIAVFGSYIHDDETQNSDIDIIVEFEEPRTLLEFIGIEQELSEKLGIKVDLLTERSISPYMIDRVKEEMKVIYQ